MAEPTSTTVIAITTGAGVGLASLFPWVDGNALMGAVLGAALVALTKKDFKPWQRIGSLVFSALVGYMFSAEVVAQTPLTDTSTGGFYGALLIVPIALKLVAYVDKIDAEALIKRFFPGG